MWVDELLRELQEGLQKQSRAAVKQATRLEAALGETDARVTALGEAIKKLPGASVSRESNVTRPDEVFDALDALDEALRLTAEPHLAQGLTRVRERLLRFCERLGYTRVDGHGELPDPQVMRIVGTEARHDAAHGTVTRVVRAAVRSGSQIVREGEVIVSTQEDSDGARLGY